MLLEVAVVGRADAVIAGNARHFAGCGVPVLSPSEYLGKLG
jgi:hypothetical protein